MIRFFEIYPDVTYIFDSTMTAEVHEAFLSRMQAVIGDKKMPIEDLCRAFNILVRISAYSSFSEQKTFLHILSRLRHSLHDIPKAYLTATLCNLIEF